MEANSENSLTCKPLELRGMIQSVWQTLEPIAQQKQLHLTYTGPDALWFEADKSLLYRALLNLFDNSIKYSFPQGEIRVEGKILTLEDAPDCVQLDIIDAGSGFPESDLPYIFERFYRADPARSRPHSMSDPSIEASSELLHTLPSPSSTSRGTGLGLAIVQKIVLAHGGTIKASNHPETGGAWMQLDLPFRAGLER